MSASSSSGPDHGHHGHGHADAHGDHACGCGHAHDHDHGHDHRHDHHDAAAGEREWTRRFLLFLELTVLLVWGVMMVWFYASGRINNYLIGEGTFRIQVLIGGLLLAVLGYFNWQMRAVPEDCGHDHGQGGGCGHDHAEGESCSHDHSHADHGHEPAHEDPAVHHHHHEGTAAGRGMALALLAVSVTAAVAMTPDDFSDQYKRNMLAAYHSRPAGQTAIPEDRRLVPETPIGQAAPGLTLAMIEKYQKRNANGNFDFEVMDLYYSGQDPESAAVMKGQGVETVGQIVKDTAAGEPGRWRVFVLQMTCCAADSRPYSVPVVFTGAVPDLQEMGWYKLTGKLDYTEERGVQVALLRVAEAQPTLRPKDQRTLF